MRHKWADVIEAYINGKRIQTRRNDPAEDWRDVFNLEDIKDTRIYFPDFNIPDVEWRVKPKMKKFRCRLALHKNESGRYYVCGYDNSVNCGIDEWFERGEDPSGPTFIKWLINYIEFDVESENA